MTKMLLAAFALTVNLSAGAMAQGWPAPQLPAPPNGRPAYSMQGPTPLYQAPLYQSPQPSYGMIIGTPMGGGFTHFSAPGFGANCINFSGFVTCR
jgi:hypothetical protein